MGETLRTVVVRLADEPTPSNHWAFYRALLAAQVAVPVRELPAGSRAGPGVADGQVSVPHTRGSDGLLMLLVYTDGQAALQAPQANAWFELAGRVVLEMAVANKVGV